MALQDFLLAVKRVSQQVAPQYGLTPGQLELALLTTAASEGGLGEQAAVGDGGLSVGRFQFHTGGGHGSTLLNQGYTREQIADDVFQAEHWAPLMAQSIVAAKEKGYTGGELLRQAAFALERPAYIYPEDRWNANLNQAGSLMGQGALSDPALVEYMAAGNQPGGTNPAPPSADPATGLATDDPLAAGLLAAAQAMQDALLKNPDDPFALDNFLNAAAAYSSYIKATQPNAPQDKAQQAFDNAIASGQLSIQQASAAWNRYIDSIGTAQTDAVNAITDTRTKNKELADMAAARAASSTPGLLPRPLVAQYMGKSYDETLDYYFDKYGVDPSAPPPAATVSLPEVPSGATDATGGRKQIPAVPGARGDVPPVNPQPMPRRTLARADEQWIPGAPPPPGYRAYTQDQVGGAPGPLPDSTLRAAGLGPEPQDSWWRRLKRSIPRPSFATPFYAQGTPPGGHPGGPAVVGDNPSGMETVILPGMSEPIQVSGAQIMQLPEGAQVIPQEQMLVLHQIQQALQQGSFPDQVQQDMDASTRANDPDLQAKVIESLRKALAADAAQNPPLTPPLGPGVQKDYFAAWRPLTGIPATGGPAQ